MTPRCIVATVLITLQLAAAASAAVLFGDVPVSNSGTSNSIAYPNTSRKVTAGPDGTIYVVYYNPSGVWVARSTNRGQSFQAPVQVGTSSAEAEIASDANGIVYVAWVQSNQATFSRSTDHGVTFSAPASIGAASGTVHMAVDAPHVYIVTKNGTTLFRNSDSGAGAFASATVDSSRQYADVHVDYPTGDVYVQTDNPTVRVFKSTDHGATFTGPNVPGGSIYYSTTVLASTESGVFLYTCGSGNTALRTKVSDYSAATLTFGTTTLAQGRTLAVDAFSNVIDGYVDGAAVKYAISTDNGASFDPPVTIATASYLSLALNQQYGDIVAVYQQNGQIFCTVYGGEIVQAPQAPTVNTAAVGNITSTSATCGGDVVVDGGATVTVRGVCWNTTGSPTTSDSTTTDGAGTGAFTSSLAALSLGTTYYVRAYATNSAGTGYGLDVEFTLAARTATVTTAAVSDLAASTATCGGNVTADGGASVTPRGVCWSTSADPTTADSHTTNGTGDGVFTSSITSLSPGTTYHVRAYATNSVGTSYGSDVEFTTVATHVVAFVADAGGTLQGATSQTIELGDSCTAVSAVPDSGYQFANWTGTGGFASTSNPLAISGVTSDLTITANFAAVPVDPGAPDLQVTIESTTEANGGTVTTGQLLSVNVNVENVGDAGATGVRVLLPLPDNMEFVSATVLGVASSQVLPAQITVEGNIVTIDVGDLSAGDQFRVELVLRAMASGSASFISAQVLSEETPDGVEATSSEVMVEDEYYVFFTPFSLCGALGLLPLFALAAAFGMIRRWRR